MPGRGEWGGKMQTDVSDGLAWLAKEGIGDADRACVVGASYGGYVAMAGVTLQQGVYRCAVSIAGVSDVAKLTIYAGDYSGDDAQRYWEDYIGDRSRQREISPVVHADQANAPLLLIHGKDDTVVQIEQSRSMARAMRRAGKPVELLEIEGLDHWLSTDETRRQALEAAINFVEKYNPAT